MVQIITKSPDIMSEENIEKLRLNKEDKKNTLASKKKELEEFEKKKRLEIEQLEERKKKELENLEKKRKELEELEKKKLDEIDYTETLIEKSFKDLMEHKRKILQEDQENLETITQKTPTSPTDETEKNIEYGRVLEQTVNPQIYDVANRQVYTSLMDIRNRAANGELTPQDEEFVDSVRRNFEKLDSDTTKENDQNGYIAREQNLLGQIRNYIHR